LALSAGRSGSRWLEKVLRYAAATTTPKPNGSCHR
jgi:hypothetical protein